MKALRERTPVRPQISSAAQSPISRATPIPRSAGCPVRLPDGSTRQPHSESAEGVVLANDHRAGNGDRAGCSGVVSEVGAELAA